MYHLPPEQGSEMGNDNVVRSLYLLSDTPSSSYFFHAPAWDSSHRIQSFLTSNKGPFHWLPFFMNWYCKGLFHGIQSFREWNARMCVSHRVAGPYRKPVSAWVPFSMGHRSSQCPAPAQASPAAAFFQVCSSMKTSIDYSVDISSTVGMHELQGVNMCHHSLHHSLRWETLLQFLEHLLPTSSLALMLSELFLSHFLSPFHSAVLFYPSQMCCHRSPTSVTDVLSFGKSILEPAGNGSVQHTDNFCCLLTKATPEAPWYQNLATWTKHSNILKTHMFCMIFRKYT